VVELFICISIWYICRSVSFGHAGVPMILLRHIVSMIVLVAVWLILVKIYSMGLDQLLHTDFWKMNYKKTLPILATLGFFFYFLACLIYYLILANEKVQETEHQIIEQKFLASQAELKSLKTTIHPHFLFNSLTALSTLTISDPKRAQEVCLQLSDFFRYNLRYSQKENITLEDELKHVENYLSIERIRFGNRLRMDMSIDQKALSVPLLPLTLLPIVENAVKHGIQQCIEGGTLFISIQKKESKLQIEVSNPFESLSQPREGEGYGLTSLRQRIRAHYGEDAHLSIKKGEKTFSVILTIPIRH
ncbi:MAG: histidine kinase, partial [Candidatus Aminicenantes bacterium]|nr:histidine kinase [Candidatus Aminicenantes bacterium]